MLATLEFKSGENRINENRANLESKPNEDDCRQGLGRLRQFMGGREKDNNNYNNNTWVK